MLSLVANIFLFTAIGLFDIYLIKTHRDTLSKRIHRWFPYNIDLSIVIGVFVFYWWQTGPEVAIYLLVGIILGHLFWSSEN